MKTTNIAEKRLLAYLGLITAIMIAVMSTWATVNTLRDYKTAQVDTEQATQNLSEVLDASISVKGEKIDLALQNLADSFEEQLHAGKTLDLRRSTRELERTDVRLPEVRALFVTDSEGSRVAAAGLRPGTSVGNASEREYFLTLRDQPDAGMFVSKAIKGRTFGTWQIAFARRYNNPDGSFAGVVVAFVSADYFKMLLSSVKLPAGGAIGLRDSDGGLISRVPTPAGEAGQPGSRMGSPELKEMLASGRTTGTFHTAATADSVARTSTFRRFAHLPMTLVVGLGTYESLAEWRAALNKTISLVAALSLLLMLASWAIWRLFVERQGAQRQQALFKSIVDSSDDAIISKTLDGIVTSWNSGAHRLFGFSVEEAVGQSMHIILPEDRRDEETRILDRIRSGQSVDHFDTVRRHKDGHLLNVSVTISPIRDSAGRVVGASKVARDISERVRATEELQQARETLESRVEERTQQLREALVKAESATRAKTDFLSNMSHEIRTPLNAIVGMARIGERDSEGPASSRVFAQITKSGQMLMEVVNDVLDFSKIEAGMLRLEHNRFSLAELVDAVAIVAWPAARAKGLHLGIHEAADLPQTCLGDALRLKQVLVNLITNAIKFTEHGSVSVSLKRTHDGELEVVVKDSGIGMNGTAMERLFKPFEQADTSTTRRFGGTGLGLSICKRIVHAMNGRIEVSSTQGKGSIFAVHLPLEEPQAPPCWPSNRIVLCGFSQSIWETLRTELLERGMRVFVLGPDQVMDTDLVLLEGMSLTPQRISAWQGHAKTFVIHAGEDSVPDHDVLAPHVTILRGPVIARQICDYLLPGQGDASEISKQGRLQGYALVACDDVHLNNFLLTDLVENEGGSIVCFETGPALLAELERNVAAYDAVLTDIQMPDMDGYEVARRIRQEWPDLPVIGITAHVMDDAREKCREAGMVAHIAKPVDPQALVSAIETRVTRSTRGTPHVPAVPDESEQQLPAQPTTWEVMDWRTLHARYAGKPQFFSQLVQVALNCLGERLPQLDEALSSADVAAQGKAIHAIKGVTGNVLAHEAFHLAGAAESAIREGDPLHEERVRDLLSACKRLQVYIEHVLPIAIRERHSDAVT